MEQDKNFWIATAIHVLGLVASNALNQSLRSMNNDGYEPRRPAPRPWEETKTEEEQ